MTQYKDMEIVTKVLDGMTTQQRREWFIKMLMSERQLTYQMIATRYKMSLWGLAGAVSGSFGWGRKVVNALEKEFGQDMTPFLTDKERKALKRD